MQLHLPLLSPRDPSRRSLVIAGTSYDVQVVRHRRARRYLLRVGTDGSLRLTVPRGASIADGLQFVGRQAAWIQRERARQRRRAAPFREGSIVLFRGRQERLELCDGHACFGTERVVLSRPCSSIAPLPRGPKAPMQDLRPIVEGHLRALAARELVARCLDLARHHGLVVARVVVRNQTSRWGSCSPRRVIALNWRLLQMPDVVCEYVLLHELMHLRQPNHSRRFWREVEAVCPAWRDSERWLRKHGRELL